MLWSKDVSGLPGVRHHLDNDRRGQGEETECSITANTPVWVAVQTDTNSSNTWDAVERVGNHQRTARIANDRLRMDQFRE